MMIPANHTTIIKFLPEDILNRINNDFKKETDNNYVKNKFLTLYAKEINIGVEQLMRSILVIANGEKDTVDKILTKTFTAILVMW